MGQVVCMRCGTLIRNDPSIAGTSHGVCASCAAKMRREINVVYPSKKPRGKK